MKGREKYKKTEAELQVKDAIDTVLELRQSLVGAQSAGQLPRGHTQAYNMKWAMQQKELEAGLGPQMPICSP